MNKQANPFDFDVTKMMGDMKVPGVDLEQMMAAQRKNIEALTTANKMAVDGAQAVARRHAEITRQAFEEFMGASRALMEADTPEARMTRQTEMAREAFEKTLANMRELAEMISKSNAETFEVITKRISEAMEELKANQPKGK